MTSFTTTTRILQSFAFLQMRALACVQKRPYDGFCYLNLAGINKFKYERKNEKNSGRSTVVKRCHCANGQFQKQTESGKEHFDDVKILSFYSFKVAEHSFGSLWVYVICQIMAREGLQLTSWNLADEKYTDERFWLTGKIWHFRSFHGNMNDWIQP